jgi:hypothetical protein
MIDKVSGFDKSGQGFGMWDGNKFIRDLADKYGVEQNQPTYSKTLDIMTIQEAALSALQERITDCQECLVSMIEQYCATDDNSYSHDFMSAGESAFDYLLKYKLADYAPNGCDIVFIPTPPEAGTK